MMRILETNATKYDRQMTTCVAYFLYNFPFFFMDEKIKKLGNKLFKFFGNISSLFALAHFHSRCHCPCCHASV